MHIYAKFIRSALKAIAGFCLSKGIKFQEFVEFAKQAFVDASREDLSVSGNENNISKMAVMTGLQRRDVTRLINNQAPRSESLNFLTKIIGQWSNDKRFSTKGKPKALTFEGVESDFFKMVQSVSKDINPYTILFELERIKAIEKKEGKLYLSSPVLDTSKDKDSSLALLSNDINDLFMGVEENIFEPQPIPNLHITTRYDNLSPGSVQEIKVWLIEKGAAFHQAARAFMSKFDRDINPELKSVGDEGTAEVSLGSFSTIKMIEAKEKIKKAG